MRTHFLAPLAVLFLLFPVSVWGQAPPQPAGVMVRATGSGTSKDGALNDAMRKAVEQGAGIFIKSKSRTENFVLVEDQIMSETKGFISRVKVLSETFDNQMRLWSVTIEGFVSKTQFESRWIEMETALKRVGRPRIVLQLPTYRNNKGPLGSTEMMNEFIKHFRQGDIDLYDAQAFLAEKAAREGTAKFEPGVAGAKAVSKIRVGDVILRGQMICTEEARETYPGMAPLRIYNWNVNLVAYRVRDWAILFSTNENKRYQFRYKDADVGYSKSTQALGKFFAQKLRRDIIKHYTFVANNRQIFIVEIKNSKFSTGRKVVRWMEGQSWCKGATRDRYDGDTKTTFLRVECKFAKAEDLADAIEEKCPIPIEITDLDATKIVATQVQK